MNKTFAIRQKTGIYILTSAILIILLASIIVNLLAIFRVGNMMSQYLPLDIVSTIIMAIVATLISIFVFASKYVVTNKKIVRYIGFLKEEIKYEDVYLMRVDSKKTMLLLYVKADEKTAKIHDEDSNLYANIVQIFIPSNKMDEFISSVKENAKDLAFEILPSNEA